MASVVGNRCRCERCSCEFDCSARRPSESRSRPLIWSALTCLIVVDGNIAAVEAAVVVVDCRVEGNDDSMTLTRHFDCEESSSIGVSYWVAEMLRDTIFQIIKATRRLTMKLEPPQSANQRQFLTFSSLPHSTASICSDRYCCLLLNYSLARTPSWRLLVAWLKAVDGCKQRCIYHAAWL